MTDSGFGERLRKFGFTEKEISTYCAILAEGEAPVSTVAEKAGVSKRHVYTTTDRLDDLGFVEVDDFLTPTILRPVPPETVYDRLSETVTQLRDDIDDRYVEQSGGDELVVLKSRESALKRLRSFIEEAEDKVALAAPASIVEALADHLVDAVDRDVFVLLLVFDVSGDDIGDFDLASVAHAVRIRRDETPLQLSVDDSHGLIGHKDIIARPRANRRVIAFVEPHLQLVVFGGFMDMWPIGEEIYVTEPESLPATYSNIYFTIIQATLHLRADEQIQATIEARPTDGSGRRVILEGEVVETRQRLVEPLTNESIENRIALRTEDAGTVTVGGRGAFLEEYEALSTRLKPS